LTTIADILKPEHVALDLGGRTDREALVFLASLFRNDPRVLRWDKLFEALTAKPPVVAEEESYDVCIPHARTESVSAMVMAAGLLRPGSPGGSARPRYLFVIALPQALSADYLRIVGSIGRILRAEGGEARLRQAADPAGFIALLSAGELGS
jgi:PTS system nitrogen regulatory IIA component